MTTIAASKYRMACDLQFTHSSGMKFKGRTKIYAFGANSWYPKPYILGAAGGAADINKLVSYMQTDSGDEHEPKIDGCEFMVLTSDKKLYTFGDSYRDWIEIDQPFYAVGSGAHFALGAMASGCDPLEAVKATMKLDAATGMGTKFIDL